MKKRLIIYLLFAFCGVSANAQRVVLIEQFTNSGCPICATHNPAVNNFVAANGGQVVSISYHTSFPYSDSMYFENPIESNERVAFYNVVGVPYSIVDGNYYRNPSSVFGPVISTTITNRLNDAPDYLITSIYNEIDVSANKIDAELVFTSLNANNINDSLQAMIVVIENTVLKSSYAGSPGANTETEYKYVMRKMIPGSAGTTLLNKNLSGTDTISFDWTFQNIKNINEVKVIAFVQNVNTQEVYQAASFTPTILTSVNTPADFFSVNCFPNPATKILLIHTSGTRNEGQFILTNMIGQTIWTGKFNSADKLVHIDVSQFPKGSYVLTVFDGMNTKHSKVILQ